jgi:hypothetical protein
MIEEPCFHDNSYALQLNKNGVDIEACSQWGELGFRVATCFMMDFDSRGYVL